MKAAGKCPPIVSGVYLIVDKLGSHADEGQTRPISPRLRPGGAESGVWRKGMGWDGKRGSRKSRTRPIVGMPGSQIRRLTLDYQLLRLESPGHKVGGNVLS